MRALLFIPVLCLCVSTGLADTKMTGTQCVHITQDTADPTIPAPVVQHAKTRAKVTYCLALVEHAQSSSSETPIDADIKRVFILSSADGATTIRVLDLAEGMGRGGF